LIFELREAGLVDGGFFFAVAPRLLAGFEALFRGLDALLCMRETRVGIGEALRMRGDAPPRLLNRCLEILQIY
jgi:hypothetical protein